MQKHIKNQKSYSVLMVGSNSWVTGSRTPKVLSLAGCHVTVMGPPDTLAGRSRYTDRFISTGHKQNEVLDALEEHLKSNSYDLIVWADDGIVDAISERWAEPWLKNVLPFPATQEAAAIASSKLAFGEAMLSHGVPYPESIQVTTLEAAREAADRLGYPIVLKAALGQAGSYVRILDHADQLADAFAELIPTGALQVQKFIKGRVGCTGALYDHGRLVAYAASFKKETFPPITGPSCVREFIDHPAMESICQEVGRITQHHGFCGIDWMLDESGDLYLIEFNARVISGYHFSGVAGVDFSKALSDMLAGKIIQPVKPHGGAVLYMYPQYLGRCSALKDWKGLLHYFPFFCKNDIPWDDLKLLIEPLRNKWRAITGQV
jgi:glutathione synthase/RimK-type ligase-like ATP-grasp enzyme